MQKLILKDESQLEIISANDGELISILGTVENVATFNKYFTSDNLSNFKVIKEDSSTDVYTDKTLKSIYIERGIIYFSLTSKTTFDTRLSDLEATLDALIESELGAE